MLRTWLYSHSCRLWQNEPDDFQGQILWVSLCYIQITGSYTFSSGGDFRFESEEQS